MEKKRTNKELPPPPPSLSPHQGSQQLTSTVIAITRADRHRSNTATTATKAQRHVDISLLYFDMGIHVDIST